MANVDIVPGILLVMNFHYLREILRLRLSSFMSFKDDKRSILVLWKENIVTPYYHTPPYSAESRQ